MKPDNQISEVAKAHIARAVSSEVEVILNELAPTVRKPGVSAASNLAGKVVVAVIALSRRKQARTLEVSDSIAEQIAKIVERSSDKQTSIDSAQGGIMLVPEKPEVWAGVVAGPTELERDYGISRSTLHRWQKRDQVIAFRSGGKKYVFPLAQFIDGRPVSGLAELIKAFKHPRIAWRWLIEPCAELEGNVPLLLLRSDHNAKVVRAANFKVTK